MSDRVELVQDPRIAEELGVSLMSMWRWDRDPRKFALGWPPRLKIGRMNFRERRAVEAFKQALIRRALDERVDGILPNPPKQFAAHRAEERKRALAKGADVTETRVR